MSERSEYALPLVVRYDNLIAIIGEKKDLAVKSALSSSPNKPETIELSSFNDNGLPDPQRTRRARAFDNILLKLRQWSNKLSYESSTKAAAGPDVLEALEAPNTQLIGRIHEILSEIALEVERCPSDFAENTLKQVPILQSSEILFSVSDQASVGNPGISP